MDQTVHVEVFRGIKGEREWPPRGLNEFVEWITEKLKSIPQESQKTARIEIGTEDHYGDMEPAMEIYYTRPETPEEKGVLQRLREAEERRRGNRSWRH